MNNIFSPYLLLMIYSYSRCDGLRASLFNVIGVEDVQRLVIFMKEFQKLNC